MNLEHPMVGFLIVLFILLVMCLIGFVVTLAELKKHKTNE